MSPHTSQSVGASQRRAPQRGHRNPAARISAWHTHSAAGAVSGRRCGKPIIIKSALILPPAPAPVCCCAGGGMSSKRRSLKWPSFMATPKVPGGNIVNGLHEMRATDGCTASFVAELAADLRLGGERDERDSYSVFNARREGFEDIARVDGRERAEDDQHLAGGVSRQVAGNSSNSSSFWGENDGLKRKCTSCYCAPSRWRFGDSAPQWARACASPK